MGEIRGPYVDGVFYNKPSETVFYCVDCANERGIDEGNALMYHQMPERERIECKGCDSMVRGEK